MTDNEIIKALEHNASKCKFYEDGHDGGLFESTLDLINRKKAKIEESKDEIKTEAIKEFAERLKRKFGIADCIVTVDNNDIDNLVKEMTRSEDE